MKIKTAKRCSLLLVFVLLLCMLSVGVTASTGETVAGSGLRIAGLEGRREINRTDPSVQGSVQMLPKAQSPTLLSSDPDTPYLFYDALNQMQKDVYNAIAAADVTAFVQQPSVQEYNMVTVEIPLTTPLSTEVQIDTDIYGNPSIVLPQEQLDAVLQAFYGGISALLSDRPALYWLGNFEMDIEGDLEEIIATSHLDASTLIAYLYLPAGYASWADVASDYSAMMQIVDNFTVRGETRYEQVKYMHDWIASSVEYDTQFQYATSFYATSVFLDPHITVCEGYSEAFKMLCDREGIPCVQVVGDAGGPHAWNYVKMEDGNWYAVDVTWDDPSTNGTFYEFFLVGADTTTRYFAESETDRTTFEQSHVPDGSWYNYNGDTPVYTLTYPTLNAQSYTPGLLLNPDAQVNVDRAANTLYVYGDAALSDIFAAPVGYSLGFANDGSTVYVYENGSTQPVAVYTVARADWDVLPGDANLDGKVDAADARWVLQAAAGMRYLDAMQTAAANVDTENGLNATDARWILQAAAGMRDLAA